MRSSASDSAALVLAAVGSLAAAAQVYAADQGPPSPQDQPPQQGGGLTEVVVTATRREETLSRVPISVSAMTQESMDQRGIKDFSDLVRFTPGVKLEQNTTNNISIRGISATGGASTTGIYIDDTPIQIRGIGGSATDTLPQAFDIDRIEVLRGPQGTLFGAGSEGGTVRYITTQASTTRSSAYSRGEVSFTQGGRPNYELGVAGGTPIIDGTLGIRVSAWYRRDGGWIDRVDPYTFQTVDANANRTQNAVVRMNMLWTVNDSWTVTPSVYYQNRRINDNNLYWPFLSDPGSDRYISANPENGGGRDRFVLPALKIEGDLGFAHLIFNSSYFDRKQTVPTYSGTLYDISFYQTLIGLDADFNFLPGFPLNLEDGTGLHLPPSLHDYRSPTYQLNTQRNVTEELRLQSANPDARVLWTVGLFYTNNRQHDLNRIYDPDLNRLTETLSGQSYQDVFGGAVNTPEGDSWRVDTHSRDRQQAIFGEATFNVTDQWKVIAGARYSHTEFAFSLYNAGAQLFADPTLVNPSQKENSFTPKLGVSFQADRDNLYYATYAKGFRPGGGNQPIPIVACQKDTEAFGITEVPNSYKSDTTQSYEVGAKNNVAGRVRVASSIYYIRWNEIQQSVYLPTCGLSFVSNLGQALAKGADIQADVLLTDALTLQLAAGYTDARYTKDSRAASNAGIVTANGDSIEGPDGRPPSPFTGTVGLEYRFTAMEHEMYVRGDYEYSARAKWVGPTQDPNTLQYNPLAFTLPSTSFASARAGLRHNSWDFSAFVDNLTDAHPIRSYDFQVDPGTGDSVLTRNSTFRPRTFGVTFTYRK